MINKIKHHNQEEINKITDFLTKQRLVEINKINHFDKFWTKYFVTNLEETISISESKLSFLIKVGLEIIGIEVYVRLGISGRKNHLPDMYGFFNRKFFNLELKKIDFNKLSNSTLNQKELMAKTNIGQESMIDLFSYFGYSAFLSPYLSLFELVKYLYSFSIPVDLRGVSESNRGIFDKYLVNNQLHFKKYSDFESFCKKNFIYHEIINKQGEFITKDLIEKKYSINSKSIDDKLGYFIISGSVFWFDDLRFTK